MACLLTLQTLTIHVIFGIEHKVFGLEILLIVEEFGSIRRQACEFVGVFVEDTRQAFWSTEEHTDTRSAKRKVQTIKNVISL